jgi:hypothetical protein
MTQVVVEGQPVGEPREKPPTKRYRLKAGAKVGRGMQPDKDGYVELTETAAKAFRDKLEGVTEKDFSRKPGEAQETSGSAHGAQKAGSPANAAAEGQFAGEAPEKPLRPAPAPDAAQQNKPTGQK